MTRHDLGNQARDARIAVDDLTAEQTKVDSDVEQVKTRRDRDRNRIDQGLVSNPRDLERMQHEMESLERRITTLEDEELEVMARLEDAQRTFDELTTQLADADARNAKLEEARDARYAEIDAELAAARRPARAGGRGRAGRPDGALRTAPGRQERCRRRGPARPPVQRLHALPRQRRGRQVPRRGRRRGAAVRGVPADPGPHGGVRPVRLAL